MNDQRDRKGEAAMDAERPTRLLTLSRRRVLLNGAALTAGALLRQNLSAQTPRPASNVAFHPPQQTPPRHWADIASANHPPGRPHDDYLPVFTPNGWTLPCEVRGGVKVFHLVAEPIMHEVANAPERLLVQCNGFNGSFPGPTLEAVQGDRLRIYVTNRLSSPTSVHWHALILPCGMDGVAGMTQPPIAPGETFVYEFIVPDAGTFMYHSHFDTMTQEGLGQIGMFIVHPRNPEARRPDRDFALLLHEWEVIGGASRPDPNEMNDFNILTINGKVFPDTHPLVAQLGDQVRIRIGNLSAMDHHPIHLHGYAFKVTATDGGPIPESAQWPETTVLVGVGQTRTIELFADNPGDWLLHCHMTHHTMNQMGHDFPNMIGAQTDQVDKKIRSLLPDYMTMGTKGMWNMATMNMPVPENTIPMKGFDGQFGRMVMGGMATTLRVREHAVGYQDPGWYDLPEGTMAHAATDAELREDGIAPQAPPRRPPRTLG